MGSGVAPMFAFAPLVPNFAADLGGNATTILLGMQNAASVGRLLSPISAVMIAVAGIANISSFELVKRTSVPVIVTFHYKYNCDLGLFTNLKLVITNLKLVIYN